jgi:hypothetical protein
LISRPWLDQDYVNGLKIAPVGLMTADGLTELRRIQADQPSFLAQFKRDKKRGNFVLGGRCDQ